MKLLLVLLLATLALVHSTNVEMALRGRSRTGSPVDFDQTLARLKNMISKAHNILQHVEAQPRFAAISDTPAPTTAPAAPATTTAPVAPVAPATTAAPATPATTTAPVAPATPATTAAPATPATTAAPATPATTTAPVAPAATNAPTPGPRLITPGSQLVIDEPGKPNAFNEVKPFVAPRESPVKPGTWTPGVKLIQPHYLVSPQPLRNQVHTARASSNPLMVVPPSGNAGGQPRLPTLKFGYPSFLPYLPSNSAGMVNLPPVASVNYGFDESVFAQAAAALAANY